MDKVRLGQITAPVGIKGEVRVFPYTDRESRFFDVKKVYVGEGDTQYHIEKVRIDKDMVVIKFKEVSDRNTSETMRGINLYVDKNDYILDEDSYFLDDLIGCRVVSDYKENLGVLTKVIQNTAQDIYEVTKDDGKTFLVPAVKDFIVHVDIENKIVVIHVIEGLIG